MLCGSYFPHSASWAIGSSLRLQHGKSSSTHGSHAAVELWYVTSHGQSFRSQVVIANAACKDPISISAAARTLSLSFATDPLISWLYRCPTGPGWGSLEPTLQRWQEARVREYTVRGIGMEAVTEGKTPSSVGVCFLFPPLPQRRWLNPLWWPAYLRVLWDQYWAKPKEPFTDEEVR